MQRPPLLELRQGPATMLQTRRLCLASWQISEALTYPKYALTHMWQHCCVCWASTLAWFTKHSLKKHGPFRHFLTEPRNSNNAFRFRTISTMFKYLRLFLYGGVLLDAEEEHFEGLNNHLVVWTFSPFVLKAMGVKDQYHSDQCHLNESKPIYMLACSETA